MNELQNILIIGSKKSNAELVEIVAAMTAEQKEAVMTYARLRECIAECRTGLIYTETKELRDELHEDLFALIGQVDQFNRTLCS